MAKETKARGRAGAARIAHLKDDAIKAIEGGLSARAFASAHGISTGVVGRWWREHTGGKRVPRPRHYTAEQRATMVADALATNPEQAGRKHGVPGNTIRLWMRQGETGTVKNGHANGHVSATVSTNGKGGDLIAAVNGVLRLLEPLNQAQRIKLLDTARGLVA